MALKNEIDNHFIIFIDWGTTNFRAYKFHLKKNKVFEKIESNKGILNIKNKSEYIRILKQTLKKFQLKKNYNILMAGMVGSKKGLYEAPYVRVPTTLKKIALKIINKKILNIQIKIIPGLVCKKNNLYDVIRGEETLAIGAIERLKVKGFSYLCCPGTHSKWLTIYNNKIRYFSTYMSGELYSAIGKGTILSQSLKYKSPKFSKIFFNKGLSLIKKDYSLPNILFKIRTMDIFKQNNASQRNSFLSGLIIGSEINEISKQKNISKSNIILVSSGPLTKFYSLSLNFYKIKFNLVKADSCFITGMKKIYESSYK